MGETGFHVHATLHLYGALRQWFQHRDDVYVASDMFLYYEEGNPHVKKAPDVMMIRGVPSHERRIFKTWEEQAAPCVIVEVTSKSTMAEDMFTKSRLYAELGVQEYFLFDPLHEYLSQALLGFRLEDTHYVPIAADDNGQMESRELGIQLCPEGSILRLTDPHTGKRIPSLEEAALWAEQEAQRAEQEAQRAEQATQRAEQEAQRAEEEAQRAERLTAQLLAAGLEPEA